VGDDAALARAIVDSLTTRPEPDRLRARAADFAAEGVADRYTAVLLGAARRARGCEPGGPQASSLP
jgi:hypothetical protein